MKRRSALPPRVACCMSCLLWRLLLLTMPRLSPAAAPKYEGLKDRLVDVAGTLGGVLGLAQGVTDNASVNVVPLPVRNRMGGACALELLCVLMTNRLQLAWSTPHASLLPPCRRAAAALSCGSLWCVQGGGAVALTETVQGTYRVDPASLRTLAQVWWVCRGCGGRDRAAFVPTPCGARESGAGWRAPTRTPTTTQVRYDGGDGVRGDLTTAHPQPMPNGDLVNLVSAVRQSRQQRLRVLMLARRCADLNLHPGLQTTAHPSPNHEHARLHAGRDGLQCLQAPSRRV